MKVRDRPKTTKEEGTPKIKVTTEKALTTKETTGEEAMTKSSIFTEAMTRNNNTSKSKRQIT
jgi:hypothetical protein